MGFGYPHFRVTHAQTGFTFIEAVLVIALIAILAGFSVPFLRDMLVRNHLDTAASETIQAFRRAQGYAQAGRTNSPWGVAVDGTLKTVTLFRGASFADRTDDYDDRIDIPASISHSGLTEVVFGLVSGLPNTAGTLTFLATNGEQVAITINPQGLVTAE